MPSYVKQGRFIDFGFEPCANAFFDFYCNPKYVSPPLLELQDIAFFLFLRKNVNPANPNWKMPSIRQMMRRLDVSQVKIDKMMARLEHARLLEKVSGYQAGEFGQNITNHYLLSDPYPTLNEFLAAAKEYGWNLKKEWAKWEPEPPVLKINTPVSETDTPPVSEINTLKQTKKEEHIGEFDDVWCSVLETLKHQLPQSTYYNFMADTKLVGWEEGTATIQLANEHSRDWVQHQLSKELKWLLKMEGKETHNLVFV